jgi:hypothetical protein
MVGIPSAPNTSPIGRGNSGVEAGTSRPTVADYSGSTSLDLSAVRHAPYSLRMAPPIADLSDFSLCWCSVVDSYGRNQYPPQA